MNMEFIYSSYLNTTTMIDVNNGTSSVQYLYDRNASNQYQSSGDNSDLTTTTITINFTAAKTLSRIALQNINWKGFNIYYNSATANRLTLSNAETSTSIWTSNSATNLYLMFTTITSVDSVSFEITTTMAANEEKKCGEMWLTTDITTLERNPSSKGYKVKLDRTEYVHNMSDGGTVAYVIGDKYASDVKLDFVSSAQSEYLYDIYTDRGPSVFVPAPTGTGWKNQIYEVNWIGDWDFYEYTDNYRGNGYSGTIRMKETPS